jgi:hypothetical protein
MCGHAAEIERRKKMQGLREKFLYHFELGRLGVVAHSFQTCDFFHRNCAHQSILFSGLYGTDFNV